MVKGWTPISFTTELEGRLKKIYDSDKTRPSSQKFGPWVGEVLAEFVEVREDTQKFGPWFTYSYVHGTNVIQLYDHTNNEPVAVLLDSQLNTMTCSKHKKSDCVHTGFCYGYPATYKILVDQGIVPDRKGFYAHAGYNADLPGGVESFEESVYKLNKRKVEASKEKLQKKSKTANAPSR